MITNQDQSRRKSRSNKACSVYGCSNRSSMEPKISLHQFPKNADMRKKWRIIFKMGNVHLNAYACSDHFQPNDFLISHEGKGIVRRLKKTAIPSLKLPNPKLDMCPSIKKRKK